MWCLICVFPRCGRLPVWRRRRRRVAAGRAAAAAAAVRRAASCRPSPTRWPLTVDVCPPLPPDKWRLLAEGGVAPLVHSCSPWRPLLTQTAQQVWMNEYSNSMWWKTLRRTNVRLYIMGHVILLHLNNPVCQIWKQKQTTFYSLSTFVNSFEILVMNKNEAPVVVESWTGLSLKKGKAVGLIFIHGSFHLSWTSRCHGELVLGHLPCGWLTGLFTIVLEHLLNCILQCSALCCSSAARKDTIKNMGVIVF